MSVRSRKREKLIYKGGFTLIELLVVISIISMLMSIMLPSLNNAREMGRRVVCQSNMRQLGIGWYTYSIENDDSLCSPNTDFNNDDIDDHWVADGPYDISNIIGGTERAIKDGVLAPYVSNTIGVYKCNSDATEMLRSYSISNTMGGYDCGCGNMTTPYSSWSQINEPSNRLAFIDADSSEPDWSERAWIAGGFWCLSEIDPATARWAVPSYNNITARHNGGTNFTYADMHCGYRRWRDERTLAIANWDFSSDNLGGDNKDLDFFLEVLKGPMD